MHLSTTFRNNRMSIEKDVKDSDMGKVVRPIFLQKEGHMFDHTAETSNASVFFFKYKNLIYACTCKHVIEDIKPELESVYLRKGNMTQILGYIDCDPLSPIPNKGFHIAPSVDVAFLYIKDGRMLDYIKSEYIILDFDAPIHNTADISEFYAFGWGNDHKKEVGDTVKTPQICCTLPASKDGSCDELNFHVELDEEHNMSLSGMSGGLVMGRLRNSDKLVPMAIIHQGAPTKIGSSIKEDTFLNQPNAIHLYCYKISPDFLRDSLCNYDISVINKESCFELFSIE